MCITNRTLLLEFLSSLQICSKLFLPSLTAIARDVHMMHISKNSPLGLNSAPFQEPDCATPYNKFPLTPPQHSTSAPAIVCHNAHNLN